MTVRTIAIEYGYRISFLDLDETMTGKMERVFKDAAHVTEEGREFKARSIGSQVLQLIRASTTTDSVIQ